MHDAPAAEPNRILLNCPYDYYAIRYCRRDALVERHPRHCLPAQRHDAPAMEPQQNLLDVARQIPEARLHADARHVSALKDVRQAVIGAHLREVQRYDEAE